MEELDDTNDVAALLIWLEAKRVIRENVVSDIYPELTPQTALKIRKAGLDNLREAVRKAVKESKRED